MAVAIDDQARWDAIHQKNAVVEEPHSKYAEEKEKLFSRGSIIVDLGGGTGADALFFLKNGHSVIVLDISQFALNLTLEKAKKLNLAQKLIVKRSDFGLNDIPLKDNSVDIVYSRISLHYFPTDQTAKIFKDVFRILKPGGTAYLTFKSPEDKNEMLFLKDNSVEYEPGVFITNGQLKSRFSIDQLNNILQKSGIANSQVKLHKESLGVGEGGVEQALLVNEIIFRK
jgi:ubiquinone/menaquinone biosynthesis C-methylase UbiE